MDYQYTTTITPERKRGQYLQAEERGAIQQLKKAGILKPNDYQRAELQSVNDGQRVKTWNSSL